MRKWILASILVIVVIASIVVTCSDRFYAPLPPEYVREKRKKTKIEPLIYDDRDFERLGKPSEGEWLSRFDELGQSFDEYKTAMPTRPTAERKHIIFLPIGSMSGEQQKILESAVEFCRIYYCSPVRLEKPVSEPGVEFSRQRSRGSFRWTQFRTDHILFGILKPSLPDDALCYLGFTMSDLYPGDSWNFVFGQGSLKDRVGVYSLFRYDPCAFGDSETAGRDSLIRLRSLKVMVHEIGHMFSLRHCIYYRCRMNGGNSLQELDSSPLHLCPICLQKLQWNLGFDIRERYQKLEDFYDRRGMSDEAAWIRKRLGRL